VPRYRFGDFTVSPRQRVLLRAGREQPLIPRYFDLLVFLLEHRHEAVHRRDIFDRVWTDVIVSDSALSQAIRTIRRALGDDPREPRFIRTISRHGYRFVHPGVHEEEDEGTWTAAGPEWPELPAAGNPVDDPFGPLLERLTQPARTRPEEDDQRDAAEVLHALGTGEALRRLGTRPGHARARALLRDTRWDAPTAGPVPVLGQPGALATAAALVRLRGWRAARLVATRWVGGSLGGGLAGVAGGATGGLILAAMPGSGTPFVAAAVLAVIGGVTGAIGGAGVGAGLSCAEALVRTRRHLAAVAGAAIGGGMAGAAVQWFGHWSLATLIGLQLAIGGGLEGLAIGGAAGAGYVLATRHLEGGMAAPRGRRRLRTAALVAAACGLAALGLTVAGRPLVGGTIHAIALASDGAQVMLTPLGQLIGDPAFGRLSQAVIGTGEGALFGFGLALGLTRRPGR
jgi:DNA-binding winged helix-turn-helix (wHTH) protein